MNAAVRSEKIAGDAAGRDGRLLGHGVMTFSND
jgi:hypothetical protein